MPGHGSKYSAEANYSDSMTGDRTTSKGRRLNERSSNPGRSARVNRSSDGEPIGASIFLTADDLAELGIHPIRSEVVDYRVRDGELRIDAAKP